MRLSHTEKPKRKKKKEGSQRLPKNRKKTLKNRSKKYSACTSVFACELDEVCLKTPQGTELCAPQECNRVRIFLKQMFKKCVIG